jgi:hypothetical protein
MNSIITRIGNKNYNLDLHNNRIDFLDTRFYITESGQYVPSVTTILEAYPKGKEYYDWLKKHGEDADTIRDEAGDRGSIVHKLTEQYDNGDPVSLMDEQGNINFNLFEWSCFEKYVEFRTRFEVDIHAIECNMSSDILGFAGTMDRDMTFKFKGKRYLCDIKTSNNIWDTHWLQMVAYRKLAAELNGADRFDGQAIIWLNAKTRSEGKKDSCQGAGWQVIFDEESPQQQWEIFQATKKLWDAKNGSMKPRQTSYKLNYQLKTA